MKKILTFIPLGVGISAAIIYIFNIIQFRVINNSITLLQILSSLKIYLYVSIIGFVFYFLIKIISLLQQRKNKQNIESQVEQEKSNSDSYEPFENINVNNNVINNSYVPNYDYVPMYHEEKKGDYLNEEQIDIYKVNENKNLDNKENAINETKNDEVKTINKNIKCSSKFCYNCGEEIYNTDSFCPCCGAPQINKRKSVNPILKNIINVLEIVILILIIYFSLNMLFDYKESKDSNFKSPFKVSMTK